MRSIYDRAKWHSRPPSDLRPTCEDLRPKEDPAESWVTRKWNWQVPRPFLTVKSDRGACRFRWRVSPSYCEYSWVTYDLLVSNIGGTYDLADQLPSNHEFGHFFVRKSVLSPSGVRCKPSIRVCSVYSAVLLVLMTSWNRSAFRITGPLWRDSTGHWWFPFTKGQWDRPLMFCEVSTKTMLSKHTLLAGDLWHHGIHLISLQWYPPDNKVHGANMGLIWGRQYPGGPHVGHRNLASWTDNADCTS